MRKLWLVALHEYRCHVLNKGFLFAVLSVPLLIAAMIGLVMLTERMRANNKPLGYVDLGGWMRTSEVGQPYEANSLDTERPVRFLAFPTEHEALGALEAGELQAYFVLSADFGKSSQVDLVYLRPPSENATAQFYDLLRLNRLAEQEARLGLTGRSPDVGRRVTLGSFMTARSTDGVREYSERAPIGFLLPMFLGLGFIILLISTSTTLAQALAEEKENRTIEVLATSVPAGQLVAGKVLGISAMGLTELAAWVGVIALVVNIGSTVPGWEWMRMIRIHPRILATVVAVALPTYVLFSGLMIALGSTVADTQESQQIGGMLSLVFTLPLYAIEAMVEHSSGALAIGLSLFPLTALISFCLLTGFTSVPLWQVGASVAILSVCALGAMWLAGRAFRLGMLRYGKRVKWRELLGNPGRSARPAGLSGR